MRRRDFLKALAGGTAAALFGAMPKAMAGDVQPGATQSRAIVLEVESDDPDVEVSVIAWGVDDGLRRTRVRLVVRPGEPRVLRLRGLFGWSVASLGTGTLVAWQGGLIKLCHSVSNSAENYDLGGDALWTRKPPRLWWLR